MHSSTFLSASKGRPLYVLLLINSSLTSGFTQSADWRQTKNGDKSPLPFFSPSMIDAAFLMLFVFENFFQSTARFSFKTFDASSRDILNQALMISLFRVESHKLSKYF